MTNNDMEEPVWRTLLGAWRELPAWQKAAIVATGLMTSPFLGLAAFVTVVSLFPFMLFGRFEGDAHTSLTHEVRKAAAHARAHTEAVYSS